VLYGVGREIKERINIMEIREQLDNLENALIDDIINTPDTEILQEVKEDYGDGNYKANEFKRILEKAKNNIKQI
jgi:hypothetical protein